MKSSFTNTINLAGYLYQAKLEKRKTGPQSKKPGTEYICGSIDIATDEACTNIVSVNYTYEVPITSKGKENSKYNFLANVMDGVYKTVMEHGKEEATKVRCASSFELNEFYSDRGGEMKFVSSKRCGAGFIHVENSIFTENDKSVHNWFKCDMVITGTRRLEANEEKNIPERVVIKGCIFDFFKRVLPVEFTVYNPAAMDYFENAEISNAAPMFTTIGGEIISQAIERKVEETSAFGSPIVKTYTSTRKDYEITWATDAEMPWDDSSTITADELKKAMQDRELALAELKSKHEENQEEKRQGGNAFSTTPSFDFGGF